MENQPSGQASRVGSITSLRSEQRSGRRADSRSHQQRQKPSGYSARAKNLTSNLGEEDSSTIHTSNSEETTLVEETNPSEGSRSKEGTTEDNIADPSARIYPQTISVRATAIDFGSQVRAGSFRRRKTIHAAHPGQCRLEVNFRARYLLGFFSIGSGPGKKAASRLFKFRADLNKVKEVYFCSSNGCVDSLLVSFPFPPKYFWTTDEAQLRTEQVDHPFQDGWNRATDVTFDMKAVLSHPLAANNDIADPEYVEIGRWTSVRFLIDPSCEPPKIEQLKMGLQDLNIMITPMPDLQVDSGFHTMWTYLDRPLEEVEQEASSLLANSSTIYIPFEIRYQLEVCVSRGILNEHTVSEAFLKKLADLDPVQAKSRLEYLTDEGRPLEDPMQLFENPEARAYLPNTRIPHYCAMVRKASITPTTIRFNTPAVETSNRVVRHYRHVADRFLRIQFVEESESGMLFMNRGEDEDICCRVLRVLHKGIRIGDRIYHFLAFGNSQLRERGAYFFCPTDHISCDDIRRWMGSFNHIRSIAKYSARLGQCFSTSREIRGIAAPVVHRIEDIEGTDGCFTDGVGMMSQLVAEFIHSEMNFGIARKATAFQFRMSGLKGVLAVWPEVAAKMEIHTRPSQEKFKSGSKGLEILRCAKYATATLNRQTITILECLGVPSGVVEDLLEKQLASYDKAMEDNTAAIDLLNHCVDENQSTLMIADFLKAGFRSEDVKEPFVHNLFNLWRSWSLKLLKEKARIYVEKSAFVLGCVDETGTLRGHCIDTEGSQEKDVNRLPQIFLQLTDPQGYDTATVIKGVCIVGRNPSLHPGDIRVVQAVDNPKLHHLKDVVVFPSKGDRPVPKMLSGGDLDGDDFFIIWDPNLIPTEWNHTPMEHAGSEPRLLDRDVNITDLKNFFLQYMRYDNLGPIAVAHLGYADNLGAKSRKCLALAQLHSTAVDYNKTGEPAKFDATTDQPKRWPHFMEKKRSYHSKKTLGKVYDRVIQVSAEFSPEWDNSFDQRIITKYDRQENMLEATRRIKKQYDTAVRRILAQQSLETEFELWSGFALSKPAVGSDYKRWEDIARENEALKSRFREICHDFVKTTTERDLGAFVTAMYQVTEDEVKSALDLSTTGLGPTPGPALHSTMPLISFPWIFPEEMIRLATGSHRQKVAGRARAFCEEISVVNNHPSEEVIRSTSDDQVDIISQTFGDMGQMELAMTVPNAGEAEIGDLITFEEEFSEDNHDVEGKVEPGGSEKEAEVVVKTNEKSAMKRFAEVMGFDSDSEEDS